MTPACGYPYHSHTSPCRNDQDSQPSAPHRQVPVLGTVPRLHWFTQQYASCQAPCCWPSFIPHLSFSSSWILCPKWLFCWFRSSLWVYMSSLIKTVFLSQKTWQCLAWQAWRLCAPFSSCHSPTKGSESQAFLLSGSQPVRSNVITGMWIVDWAYEHDGSRSMQLIHLDSVIWGACTSNPCLSRGFGFNRSKYEDSLDRYDTFYVNQYVDHHAFETIVHT